VHPITRLITRPLLMAVAFIAAFAVYCLHGAHDLLFGHLVRTGAILGVNAFNKEERVAFEDILEGFQDALVLSRNVSVYQTNPSEMERSTDIIWRPQPYVAQSFNGTDMTANFLDQTQLSVPATIGFQKSSPWRMTATELRDALQEQRLGDAARQKLASDINVAINNVAAMQGTLVVKRTTAATGFDDMAQAEAMMNEQGVQMFDRYAALSTRDYNGMASNLAGRGTMQGKPVTAYEKAFVGNVANFDTYKMDYTPRQAAATATGVTINGANQFYVPKAISVAGTGESSNVDNRYQTIAVTVTTSTIKVGDCFTIAGVNAVHHITKQDTGQLKTFRVIAIVTGAGGTGTIQISPPLISGQGASVAELTYQNVTATPANGAAITFLNTAAGYLNPFWQKDALELLPSNYAVPTDAGVAVMRASTDQGIEVVMQKFYDINTMLTKFRLDCRFGVCNKQPEMSGVILFSQP